MDPMPWLLGPVMSILSTLTNNTSISAIVDSLKTDLGNSTLVDSSPQDILTTLLDFFIPEHRMMSQYIPKILGVDVSWLLFIWLAVYVHRWLVNAVRTAFNPILQFCSVECEFGGSARLYQAFFQWAQDREIGLNSRLTLADVKEVDLELSEALNDFDPIRGVSLRRSPWILSLKPSYGSHWFFYKWHLFCFTHYLHNDHQISRGFHPVTSLTATLTCIGFSQQPLKDLFSEALRADYHSKKTKTNIYSVLGNVEWDMIASRDSRSINTVVLDAEEKSKILSDIAEFLKSKSQNWYTDRGLPYKRGYLFSGPPGTGKSSLSFVIAGMFDMDVYNLSLQDWSIDDKNLMLLFNDLPSKCIILMEDIDSAGIQNRGSSITAVNASGTLVQVQPGHTSVRNTNVTLAGLLNVIDGIASKDGRILIMTTNKVDALDPALVRPGRIDMIIDFKLLSRKGTQELFVLMYKPSPTETIKLSPMSKQLASDTLEKMAAKFAKFIPEGKFSPAEVQGYLICHKDNPEAALAGVKSWVIGQLEKKYGIVKSEDDGKQK